jgi:small subunit ribosomal protein S20
MANIKSAIKRIRTAETRRTINQTRISRMRTFIKKVETAIAAGDAKAADTAFQAMQPEVQRTAAKNTISKNAASRTLSRLSAKIAALKGKKTKAA